MRSLSGECRRCTIPVLMVFGVALVNAQPPSAKPDVHDDKLKVRSHGNWVFMLVAAEGYRPRPLNVHFWAPGPPAPGGSYKGE